MTTVETANVYDVAVIGAGAAGASAAIFTARAGLRTLLVDANEGGLYYDVLPVQTATVDGQGAAESAVALTFAGCSGTMMARLVRV